MNAPRRLRNALRLRRLRLRRMTGRRVAGHQRAAQGRSGPVAEPETPEEFRERLRSLQVIRGGRTRPLEKIITRPDKDPAGNQVDAGRRAKMVISEERDIVLTTSDNRQDANVFGKPARIVPTERG
jgi:hypothetical protein